MLSQLPRRLLQPLLLPMLFLGMGSRAASFAGSPAASSSPSPSWSGGA